MSYYQLRDIQTPPFAYVIEREASIQYCDLCRLPFRKLVGRLKVEIFTTDIAHWKEAIVGQPLMAEHWLIGDAVFADRLEALLPKQFSREAVEISSWLVRNPQRIMAVDNQKDPAARDQMPTFYLLMPVQEVPIEQSLMSMFPPLPCSECGRDMPDIPIDYQLAPENLDDPPLVASLKDVYLEGYEYLFHESVIPRLKEHFPKMIWESLDREPTLF